MSEIEQLRAAQEPLQEIHAEFPGRRRRRLLTAIVVVFVVVVLAISSALFVNMNNRIHKLDRTTAAQAVQIHQLQASVNATNSSLSAAVACLQTVGSLEGLCSKLTK